jgi:long-chain acyl-CoA synthetase
VKHPFSLSKTKNSSPKSLQREPLANFQNSNTLSSSMDLLVKVKQNKTKQNNQPTFFPFWFGILGALSWSEFLGLSNGVSEGAVEERLSGLKEEDLATFIYTSGTTGPPKGVMLSHRNLVTAATVTRDHLLNPQPGDRAISYLPLSHIAEQLCTILVPAVTGTTVFYSEGLLQMPRNLIEVQPTFFFAPPRFWEKFYSALKAKIPEGVPPSSIPEAAKSEMRKAIGMNQARTLISGAAPISTVVLDFFRDYVGITIQEVFGQSESTGLATVSSLPNSYKPGTVGKPFPGLRVKLSEEEGEILLQGSYVSLGYYKDPINTRETFDSEGWLQTGDLGSFDNEGFLSIIGRKKDIVITAGGENIAAPRIEKNIEVHPLVQNAVVVGDKRPFLTALITLDPEAVEKITTARRMTYEQFVDSQEAKTLIQDALHKVNSTLARVSTVKRFKILPRPFSIQTGEGKKGEEERRERKPHFS